ncbi:MAG: hypothetical protein QME64_10000 [bacterium]|nr:hypothetical protein [bacterium]
MYPKTQKKLGDNWYRLPFRPSPKLITLRTPFDRHIVYYNQADLSVIDHVEIHVPSKYSIVCTGLLNSSIYALLREILGRHSLGQGTLKTEVMDWKTFPIISPKYLDESHINNIEYSTRKIWDRNIEKITDEINLSDRRILDSNIFDALGLTAGEREAVYEAVIQLVSVRLKKAESV